MHTIPNNTGISLSWYARICINVHGVEEIVAVRTFRSRLPVRRVRHMDRRSQEVQNNFLTDHIIKFLSGSSVRSPKGRQKRSERPSADRFQAVSDTIARDRRLFP